jgi:hypothetical protein
MENKGLKDILKKQKNVVKNNIPKKILNENLDNIPELIMVVYNQKINIDQIDEVVIFRLKKLKLEEDLKSYSEISKEKIRLYKEHQNKYYLENYLDLCSRYIRVERIKNVKNNFKCQACDKSLEDLKEDSDGVVVCDECNCINTYMAPLTYKRDIDKFNYYFDEEINNFVKILDKFEGKTNLILGKNFFNLLDDFFINLGMKTGEEIRKLPRNLDGKKDGTSKKLLWCCLEKLGYSQHYDETSYICNVYWDWKLPDLTKYRDQLIKDYQLTQNVWNSIKGEYKRSASLGTQFRLYVQLMAVGYPHCNRDDFKIQENIESLRIHNEAWKRMCDKCNIKYYYVTT